MKQQTAVDWLYSMMFEKNGRITKEEYEQAKEIEKQQIIDAVTFGQNNHTIKVSVDLEIAEQYFKEKFAN